MPQEPILLANGGDTQPQVLPQEDYQALREIVYQELCRALPAVDVIVVEQLREYYYPSNAQEEDNKWTYHCVKEALRSNLRAESIGKNIRAYKSDVANKVIEQIGLRFVRWKLERTPDLPTQTPFAAGPGERDISFTKDGGLSPPRT